MCDVIKLPGAAQSPVVQPPRRGRLPKAIGSLYVARARRYSRAQEDRDRQRQQAFEQGRRDERMAQVLYSALAEVNAGRASGLLVALRYGKSEKDHFVCEGLYRDEPWEAAAVADSVAETLRERDCAGE